VRTYLKKKKKSQKRAGGVVQGVGPKYCKGKKRRGGWGCCSVIERLPSVLEILGLIPSAAKKKSVPENS
jgi:hypothetical protein